MHTSVPHRKRLRQFFDHLEFVTTLLAMSSQQLNSPKVLSLFMGWTPNSVASS